jgi:hypothetical protein
MKFVEDRAYSEQLLNEAASSNPGKWLNTGEFTLLQREVQPFIRRSVKSGLKVTAVHNHWLFDKPRLMYVHVKSVENPNRFANKVASIFKCVK